MGIRSKGRSTRTPKSRFRRQKRMAFDVKNSTYFTFYVGHSTRQGISLLRVVVVFTLTDRASTIYSSIRGCQSGTWPQRGTKVNGSHHGDNPLLRPTGIQIATKSYATLQAMAPTNNKTVHQTSFTPYREQPRSTRIVVAYPRPAFSATNRTYTFQPILSTIPSFLRPHIVQK